MSACLPEGLHSKTLDHHGLVAAVCKELQIARWIDEKIPAPPGCKVTHGERVVAMIINGLGFVQRTLYMSPHFFDGKPLDRLIGPHVTAQALNDDALGRTLDALFEAGLTDVFSYVALHVIKRLGLVGKSLHLDSTSFHVDGVYNSKQPPQEGEAVVHVTRGYSRDHRPDLNQVVLQLVVENQAGIPMLMQMASGNQADKTGFRELIANHVQQLKQSGTHPYIVADAALYTRENIASVAKDFLFITRIPRGIKQAKAAIEKALAAEMTRLDEKLQYREVTSNYGNVKQRFIVVSSQDARVRAEAAVASRARRELEKAQKEWKKITQKEFSCQQDARQALQCFVTSHPWIQVQNSEFTACHHYARAGRPKAKQAPQEVCYALTGEVIANQQKAEDVLRTEGFFVLATNELDQQALPAADVIKEYKNQSKVERGFRFLKDPLFAADTFYVQKTERLMALGTVMTFCLMLYAATQHLVRKNLAAKQLKIPDQQGRGTSTPTARWVFQSFMNIHLLCVPNKQEAVLNLTQTHLTILQALGPPYEKMYAHVE